MTVVILLAFFRNMGGRGLWKAGVVAHGAALAGTGCGDSAEHERNGERPLAVVASFGEVGLSPGQFTYPRVIENDGKSLYVIDKAAHVQRLDPKTGEATAMWTMPDSVNGKPCGATI